MYSMNEIETWKGLVLIFRRGQTYCKLAVCYFFIFSAQGFLKHTFRYDSYIFEILAKNQIKSWSKTSLSLSLSSPPILQDYGFLVCCTMDHIKQLYQFSVFRNFFTRMTYFLFSPTGLYEVLLQFLNALHAFLYYYLIRKYMSSTYIYQHCFNYFAF